jgi:hypothetical protein
MAEDDLSGMTDVNFVEEHWVNTNETKSYVAFVDASLPEVELKEQLRLKNPGRRKIKKIEWKDGELIATFESSWAMRMLGLEGSGFF